MQFLQSPVGRKILMAVTGTIMALFIVVHLLGNASVFSGPDALNAYAHFLQSLGAGKWAFRLVLSVVAFVHIWFAFQLTFENWGARPDGYQVEKNQRTTFGAKTMFYSGLFLFAFILYHLAHFTLKIGIPAVGFDAHGNFDVYSMMVLSFQNILVAIIYIAAMAALLLHLSHGVQSLLQTFGLLNAKTLPGAQNVSRVVAAALALGYIAIPMSILVGIVNA